MSRTHMAYASSAGLCMERGCRNALTPTGRVKKQATVLVVDLDGLTIRLCPAHAWQLVESLAGEVSR